MYMLSYLIITTILTCFPNTSDPFYFRENTVRVPSINHVNCIGRNIQPHPQVVV